MKLKTQVLLAGASTIIVCFCVSEALNYRQAAEFLTQHEMRIQQGEEGEALLSAFRQEKQFLLRELAALRLLSAVGAVTALLVALNFLWGRLFTRPLNLLLDGMTSMGRGGWTQPIPVERKDEIGELVKEFNILGPRLTFAAHQYAAASKLAAMALIGQRVTRRTNIARKRVLEIQELMSEARYLSQVVPMTAVHKIGKVAEELADLAGELESEFNDELVRQGLPARLNSGENGRTSLADPRQDHLIAS